LKKVFIIFIVLVLTACTGTVNQPDIKSPGDGKTPVGETGNDNNKDPGETQLVFPRGGTVTDRIMVPEGYERVSAGADTFAHYLRNLPLKSHGSKVLYYDGREKGRDVYQAVVDMDVGDRDLQQCADAVIRLRAEYLYKQQQYERIHFNFTNGFNAGYDKWMQGNRIAVSGNDARWVSSAAFSDDYQSFRKYLDMVFAYTGTLSLSRELEKASISDMEIGDVFIQGGSPGHCVIVVDMAQSCDTGEKLFLLAQSYMPAQDIHILKNLQDKPISPWYSLDFGDTLITPEWTFDRGDLMRFGD
jgi:hypothetical protein